MASGKEVQYIDILTKIINFPYSTCISFFGSSIPTCLFIFKMFFRSCLSSFFTILYQRLLKEHTRLLKKNANIIGASLSEPHTYRIYSGEKSSSYIYICFLYIYIYIYIRPYVVHVPLTRALRANVGPAG